MKHSASGNWVRFKRLWHNNSISSEESKVSNTHRQKTLIDIVVILILVLLLARMALIQQYLKQLHHHKDVIPNHSAVLK